MIEIDRRIRIQRQGRFQVDRHIEIQRWLIRCARRVGLWGQRPESHLARYDRGMR